MDNETQDNGANFISPNASPQAKKFIEASRALMFAKQGQMIKQAISQAKNLSDGASQIIVMLVRSVEGKLGQLSPDDLKMVVAHLAGTIVYVARRMGDPSVVTDNGTQATQDTIQKAMEALAQNEQAQQPQGLMTQGAVQ